MMMMMMMMMIDDHSARLTQTAVRGFGPPKFWEGAHHISDQSFFINLFHHEHASKTFNVW